MSAIASFNQMQLHELIEFTTKQQLAAKYDSHSLEFYSFFIQNYQIYIYIYISDNYLNLL